MPILPFPRAPRVNHVRALAIPLSNVNETTPASGEISKYLEIFFQVLGNFVIAACELCEVSLWHAAYVALTFGLVGGANLQRRCTPILKTVAPHFT